jgi:hypothetical protein
MSIRRKRTPTSERIDRRMPALKAARGSNDIVPLAVKLFALELQFSQSQAADPEIDDFMTVPRSRPG